MPDGYKGAVTKVLAQKPVKAFVICSNKKNMRRYRNIRAERMGVNDCFYCWDDTGCVGAGIPFRVAQIDAEIPCPKADEVDFQRTRRPTHWSDWAYYQWIKSKV